MASHSEWIITCEAQEWTFRLARPDGTDHPDYDAIVEAMKVTDDTIRLFGAHGPWRDHMRALFKQIKGMGFEHVIMTRHGKTRAHDIDALIRHS